MAATGRVFGVTKNDDLRTGLIRRDTRTAFQKFNDFTKESSGEVMMGMGVAIIYLGFAIPPLGELLFFIFPFYYLYQRRKKATYQLNGFVTEVDGKAKPIKGTDKGIMLLGVDYDTRTPLILNDDQLRAHALVLGTTGSGKTRFLLGLMYQSMMFGNGGSGIMYVDGKGDNTVLWFVYTFCQKLDRLPDLLVMNFITSDFKKNSRSSRGSDPLLRRTSNTCNPFSYGDSVQLRSLIAGLMRDDGGGDMWKGRAISMIGALLNCCVDMRDEGLIDMDIEFIRDRLPLDEIIKIYKSDTLSIKCRKSIQAYLESIPGVSIDAINAGEPIQPKSYEQHGFLQMQFSEVLGDLAEVYSHIFIAIKGEIDYTDVVLNRRILFVILPSLEKAPDALAGLGKICVAGVRSALSPLLGSEAEGAREQVIDNKPSSSSTPFLLILDEYGYYSVKGFALVAAQARSLGVSVFFASQDTPSLEKSSKEEAKSTIANTSLKVFMKLEDADDTFKLAEQRGGQAYTNKLEGHERVDSDAVFDGYKAQQRVNVEQMNRVNLRDLVAQDSGEAHFIVGDGLFRGRVYFADPKLTPMTRINRFLMVKSPDLKKVKDTDNVKDKILDFIHNSESVVSKAKLESTYRPSTETLRMLSGLSQYVTERKLNTEAKAQYIAGAYLLQFALSSYANNHGTHTKKQKEELIKENERLKAEMLAKVMGDSDDEHENLSTSTLGDRVTKVAPENDQDDEVLKHDVSAGFFNQVQNHGVDFNGVTVSEPPAQTSTSTSSHVRGDQPNRTVSAYGTLTSLDNDYTVEDEEKAAEISKMRKEAAEHHKKEFNKRAVASLLARHQSAQSGQVAFMDKVNKQAEITTETKDLIQAFMDDISGESEDALMVVNEKIQSVKNEITGTSEKSESLNKYKESSDIDLEIINNIKNEATNGLDEILKQLQNQQV